MYFYGFNWFGIVLQVPGHFHIATRFFHINSMPLIPTESVLFFCEQYRSTEEGDEPIAPIKLGLFAPSVKAARIAAAAGTLVFLHVPFIVWFAILYGVPMGQREFWQLCAGIGVFASMLGTWKLMGRFMKPRMATRGELKTASLLLRTRRPRAAAILADAAARYEEIMRNPTPTSLRD